MRRGLQNVPGKNRIILREVIGYLLRLTSPGRVFGFLDDDFELFDALA
jgi:hypothetical protein